MGRKSSKFMNKKVTSLFLAAALATTQLTGMSWMPEIAFAEEVDAKDTNNLIQDATFAGNLWDDGNWTVAPSTWENTTFEYFTYMSDKWMTEPTESNGAGFHFWMQNQGDFTLTQTIVNLPAGTYEVTAEVMGDNADISIILADNKLEPTVSLEGYNNWKMISTEITVAEDMENVTVGFSTDVREGGYGYIDRLVMTQKSVETEETENTETTEETEETEKTEETESAEKTEESVESETEWVNTDWITNGNFETGDTTGWEVSQAETDEAGYRVCNDEWAFDKKNQFLNVWNNSADTKTFSATQTISDVPAGEYKLSLRQSGLSDVVSGLKITINDTNLVLPATTGWDDWTTIESDVITLSELGTITITLSGEIAAGYWGDYDDFILSSYGEKSREVMQEPMEDTSVEAPIYVEKNKAIDDDFITGADVSSYLSEINSGAKFYDFDGNELDEQGFFNLLAAGGTNYIRLRVWNNPYDANGNGYGGGNNDLAAAVKMGKWATNAGMKVLIDFHYSDFWADPGKQKAPKAWESMAIDKKEQAVYDYTKESLQTLLDAGVNVGMVQVGNETTGSICGEDDWINMAKIFKAGSKAIRDISAASGKEILVAVHFTNPETSGKYATLAKKLDTYGVDYDVFASSYYPYWHGTTSNLTKVLKDVADTYDKKVMVAETSWATTLLDGDGHDNTVRVGNNDTGMSYDFSVQGQANEMAAVAKAVTNVGDAGIGIFYWEAAWIPVAYAYDENGSVDETILESNKTKWEANGSGWASSYAGEYDAKDAGKWFGGSAVDNQAWFDFDGKPFDTVNFYNYIRSGAKTEEKVTSVQASDVTIDESDLDMLTLPEKATINYNTGKTIEKEIVWDEQELANAIATGVGVYTMHGTVDLDGQAYAVSIMLTVHAENLLVNPGFENGLDDWEVSSNGYLNSKDTSSNSRTGNGCLHFYSSVSDVSSTATQVVRLNAGKYLLGGFLQGGSAGNTDSFTISATVSNQIYTANGSLQGWKEWDELQTSFEVQEDDTEVVISIAISDLTAGVWGSFDDMILYRVGDCEPEENVPTVDVDKQDTGVSNTENTNTENADVPGVGNADTEDINDTNKETPSVDIVEEETAVDEVVKKPVTNHNTETKKQTNKKNNKKQVSNKKPVNNKKETANKKPVNNKKETANKKPVNSKKETPSKKAANNKNTTINKKTSGDTNEVQVSVTEVKDEETPLAADSAIVNDVHRGVVLEIVILIILIAGIGSGLVLKKHFKSKKKFV